MKTSTKQTLQQFWKQRTPRERGLLVMVGSILLIAIAYRLVWTPYWNTRQRLSQQIPILQTQLSEMRQDESLIQHLQQANLVVNIPAGRLRETIEESLGRVGLSNYVEKMEDSGEGRITLTASQIPFSQWLRWLERVSKEIGIGVQSATITSEGEGVVRVEATLMPLSEIS